MIFDSQLYDIVLFIIPIIIASVFNMIYEDAYKINRENIIGTLFIYLIGLIIPISAGVCTLLVYQSHPTLSITTYILTLISLLTLRFLIFPIVDKTTDFPKVFNVLQFVLAFLPVLILLITLPTMYISYSGKNSKTEISLISTFEIEESFSNIQQSFKDIDLVITKETNNIDDLLGLLKTSIEEKNNQLIELNKQQEEMLKQIEYYKELSKISEKQSKALVQALNKDKYTEYAIGLFLGLISSFLASMIYSRIVRLKTTTNRVDGREP